MLSSIINFYSYKSSPEYPLLVVSQQVLMCRSFAGEWENSKTSLLFAVILSLTYELFVSVSLYFQILHFKKLSFLVINLCLGYIMMRGRVLLDTESLKFTEI